MVLKADWNCCKGRSCSRTKTIASIFRGKPEALAIGMREAKSSLIVRIAVSPDGCGPSTTAICAVVTLLSVLRSS